MAAREDAIKSDDSITCICLDIAKYAHFELFSDFIKMKFGMSAKKEWGEVLVIGDMNTSIAYIHEKMPDFSKDPYNKHDCIEIDPKWEHCSCAALWEHKHHWW